jgi:hypothetical protein
MLHRFCCKASELDDINVDFALQIAHQNFRNCHSERSEESRIITDGLIAREQYGDVSTPLDMTDCFSRWRPVFRLKIARDQTCSLIKAQIRPCPLKEHEQPIAEPDKEDDVHE